MALFEAFLGLNPDIDKRRSIAEKKIDKKEYTINSFKSLKNSFFFNTEIKENESFILDSISSISSLKNNWNNFGTPKINSEIILNSLKIIQYLPPSILNFLKPENVYPTKMGTIIMDWEIDENNILSLEIAKKSVGYFVEVNGKDYKEVEKINIEDISLISSSLNNDLSYLIYG